MLLSAACFTANILLIRALGQLESVNVWLISCTRFAGGLALVALLYRANFSPRRLFTNRGLAERGFVGALGVYGSYLTIVKIGAGRSTFIISTYVGFAGLMAAWVLREKIRAALVWGGVATLAGLALLTDAFAAGAQIGGYDVMAVAVALGSAYVVVTIRQLHAAGETTANIFGAQCVYGLLLCGGPALLHPQNLSAAAWGVMLIASVCSAVGQIAMTRGFRDLPVAEGSLIQLLAPVGVALGGALFFHEHFSPREIAGAALILAGAAFTVLRR